MRWTPQYTRHALTTALLRAYRSSKTEISTAITLTLLLRSVGALIFGATSDALGRKYPLFVNMLVLGALQVGSVYAPDWNTFLAIRALFGLGMGGV